MSPSPGPLPFAKGQGETGDVSIVREEGRLGTNPSLPASLPFAKGKEENDASPSASFLCGGERRRLVVAAESPFPRARGRGLGEGVVR